MSNPSDGPDLTPPPLCGSSGKDAENLGVGIGKSFLNILGFGWTVKSPLDELNKRIKNLSDLTQQVLDKGVIMFAKTTVSLDESIIKDMSIINTSLQNYVQYYSETIREKGITNSILIYGSYIIILIILVFFIISK
jgi:hypothetical protein